MTERDSAVHEPHSAIAPDPPSLNEEHAYPMAVTPHDPPQWARNARPANVRATGSAAPEQYEPIPEADTPDCYTHRSHAAQYGAGRRWGFTVRAGILHTTETDDSNPLTDDFASSLTRNMYNPNTVSATGFAGELGQLGHTVPVDDRPWTTGRWNDETESLEIVGRAAWPAVVWRARTMQLEAITVWMVDVARRRGLPARWLTAEEFAQGASRQSTSPRMMGELRGFTDHYTANQAAIMLGGAPSQYSHWDVGPGLRQVIVEDVMPEVARRLNPPDPTEENMTTIRFDGYADQFLMIPLSGETKRRLGLDPNGDADVVASIDPADALKFGYQLTPLTP